MSLTDQELETFLDEIGIFSEGKLSSLLEVEKRPLPKLPLLPQPTKKPRKWFAIWLSVSIMAAFVVGLFMGLSTAASSQKKLDQIQEQLSYVIQKMTDVEESFTTLNVPPEEIIEPLFDEEIPKNSV